MLLSLPSIILPRYPFWLHLKQTSLPLRAHSSTTSTRLALPRRHFQSLHRRSLTWPLRVLRKLLPAWLPVPDPIFRSEVGLLHPLRTCLLLNRPRRRFIQERGIPYIHQSQPAPRSRKPSPLETATLTVVLILFDFIPRQLYLHFLLRIPSLYFSRVTRIFEDARLSLPDIKRMARARPDQWTNPSNMNPWQPNVPSPDRMRLPQSLLQFRSNWEAFIESLMREWNTFNIISVLLLSAILTMLQIESASHPITRVSALLSLICALMSLLYGCMYIIRFGTMRKMHKASSFAGEAQKGTTSILWNIWVLLAMPAVWLAWSIISFLTCVMSFIWLSGTSQDQNDFAMSPRAALGCRLGLTLVFALGVIYFALIIKTFYQYGDPLDREWTRTVNGWMKETATYPPLPRNMYNAREAPVMPGMPFLRPESQRNPSHTSFRRGPPMFSSLKPGEGYFDRLPRFTPLSLKPHYAPQASRRLCSTWSVR
ncbi:hypothetical protein C8R45DRAFT_277008 [Mycena sanguinolenta]|nr:hypothetical protein C8R45DRAFT_277008 [Mycena sanguinolenta]